jgi:fructokinase
MHQQQLFPLIRKKLVEMLNGYVQSPTLLTKKIDDYIVPAKLGNHAGVLGSVALAFHATI